MAVKMLSLVILLVSILAVTNIVLPGITHIIFLYRSRFSRYSYDSDPIVFKYYRPEAIT